MDIANVQRYERLLALVDSQETEMAVHFLATLTALDQKQILRKLTQEMDSLLARTHEYARDRALLLALATGLVRVLARSLARELILDLELPLAAALARELALELELVTTLTNEFIHEQSVSSVDDILPSIIDETDEYYMFLPDGESDSEPVSAIGGESGTAVTSGSVNSWDLLMIAELRRMSNWAAVVDRTLQLLFVNKDMKL